MPALGSGSLPERSRSLSHSAALSRSKVPSILHLPNPSKRSPKAGTREAIAARSSRSLGCRSGVEDLARAVDLRSSLPLGRQNVGLDCCPFCVGEIGLVAPFHTRERTPSIYPLANLVT